MNKETVLLYEGKYRASGIRDRIIRSSPRPSSLFPRSVSLTVIPTSAAASEFASFLILATSSRPLRGCGPTGQSAGHLLADTALDLRFFLSSLSGR